MCGIVGFNWEDEQQVRRLADLLRHRGPEQEGFHVADGVSLGHRRLRIIDLSEHGRQPIYNEDGTVCVVFNGEIFNFQILRQELEQSGHRFVSRTDTEVLVHGYEQWGTDLLQRIRGQFAFCLLDKTRRQLLLARDPLGIKPLYYYDRQGRFMFGSELKVFLKGGIPRQISRPALDHYLMFGNTPSGQSILEGVCKVLPGEYLVYDLADGRIAEQARFWELVFRPDEGMTEAEAADQIRLRLGQAVREQLVSDVPLGAFLSGGVDSSILVALMRPNVKELNTFSIRFDRPAYNESTYAKIVSDRFNTIHHEIEFDATTVRQLIDELPHYFDEPFGDPSMIPTCLVCRVARQHVTVALSGTGGDELFAGYPRYKELRVLQQINRLPGPVKGAMDLGIHLLNAGLGHDKLYKLRSFLGPRQELWQVYLRLFSYMFRRPGEHTGLDRFESLKRYFDYTDPVTSALNFDLHEYLPEDLLTKEDRASMAISLEARVPFLDPRFVEFAATIPTRLKIRGSDQKAILKEAFRGILPDSILYRKKRGFGVPLPEYFRCELKDLAEKDLFGPQPGDYFDRDLVASCWQRHHAGRADYSRLFWTVIMFNRWHRMWMG